MSESPPPLSARALRGNLRTVEGEATRLRLLQAAAQRLADETQLRSALTDILALAAPLLAADSAVLLVQDAGALHVQAAFGDVLPVGARIPLGGVLGAVLKPPMQPSLREHLESRLRIGREPQVALELLLPLRLGGRALGVLALMSTSSGLRPSAEDLTTLQALCTLLAASVHAGSGLTRPKTARREAAASIAQLTPREQQVFALLPRGLSNAELGKELGIATGTAKIHIERILHKLGLKDRTQAAVRAAELGYRP